jgi:hypothetical protein
VSKRKASETNIAASNCAKAVLRVKTHKASVTIIFFIDIVFILQLGFLELNLYLDVFITKTKVSIKGLKHQNVTKIKVH